MSVSSTDRTTFTGLDGRTRYVAGFLFRGPSIPEAASVALVRKLRPDWQRGLWNGVGGKMEKGEGRTPAMLREGLEEAGIPIDTRWDGFHSEIGRDYVVHFFRALAPVGYLLPDLNDAGEMMRWHGTSLRPDPDAQLVGNLRWLVPMAQDWRRVSGVTESIGDDISSRPAW